MLSGFNPCFNGSDSKRKLFRYGSPEMAVSILVLMEVTLKDNNDRPSNGTMPFQSLF